MWHQAFEIKFNLVSILSLNSLIIKFFFFRKNRKLYFMILQKKNYLHIVKIVLYI